MTNDNRLQHETSSRKSGSSPTPAQGYKSGEDREDELKAISPVFRRLLCQKQTQPSPEQWRNFSQQLSRKLELQDAPYSQTLRDRISGCDSTLLRWLWVILALLALIAIGAGIGFSLVNDSAPTAVANLCLTYNKMEML